MWHSSFIVAIYAKVLRTKTLMASSDLEK